MKQVISVFLRRKHDHLYFLQVIFLTFPSSFLWNTHGCFRQLKREHAVLRVSIKQLWSVCLFSHLPEWRGCTFPAPPAMTVIHVNKVSGPGGSVLCLPRWTGKTSFLVSTFVLRCKERGSGRTGWGLSSSCWSLRSLTRWRDCRPCRLRLLHQRLTSAAVISVISLSW